MPPLNESIPRDGDLILPRAILFDLDDTILDDNGQVDACWREVCAGAVVHLRGVSPETLLASIERERDSFWSDAARHYEGRMDLRAATRRIVQQALVTLGFDPPELAAAISDRYRDLRYERLHPFPGAIETLERLRTHGVRLALITNGSAAGQRAKIERFDLARHFDHIVVEGEFGVGKPDPRVYEAALAALATVPSQAWCVGDNLEWDVAAPQQLGLHGIWVDFAGAGLPADTKVTPGRIIRSIIELA